MVIILVIIIINIYAISLISILIIIMLSVDVSDRQTDRPAASASRPDHVWQSTAMSAKSSRPRTTGMEDRNPFQGFTLYECPPSVANYRRRLTRRRRLLQTGIG